MMEKHRWADLLKDVPADPALAIGDGSFPLPFELRQSIAQHLESLGFQLPVGARLAWKSPSEDPMLSAAATGVWVSVDEGGDGRGD